MKSLKTHLRLCMLFEVGLNLLEENAAKYMGSLCGLLRADNIYYKNKLKSKLGFYFSSLGVEGRMMERGCEEHIRSVPFGIWGAAIFISWRFWRVREIGIQF